MNKHFAPLKREATYRDVLDAPDNVVAEILDGELSLQPRPAPRHAVVEDSLISEYHDPFQRGRGGPGGWWIVSEPEIHFGKQVVVPDVAGWRRERPPELPSKAFFEIAPDWVCEVLSPATRRRDLTTKRRIYGENGVEHLWFIDPDALTLEAFRRIDGKWVLMAALAEDEAVCLDPFAAVTFPLDSLWAK
ncbi:MAG TPA: Uma2 family endonuclease [Rhizobiaceae bacterium]|nr:Uma2 family endonuclease [Rhizobiaceae bacterium]